MIEDEFQKALVKKMVPTLEKDVWRVCTAGYRVEGWGEDRYLVPTYDVSLQSKWRTTKPLEEQNLVPGFVKAYRKGLERSNKHPLDPTEFEKPILAFVGEYGLGLTGERRWAGGREESIRSYLVVMQTVAPLVHLFEALVSGEESDVQAALEDCPQAQLWDAVAGETAEGVGENGQEYQICLREHALLGLGYFVADWFHKLCFPFAIPEPHARRLDQVHTGWGFSNLTGAMFWHLYQLLSAQSRITRCEHCGNLIINARKGQRFCSNDGKCRNMYDHHSGRRAERARRKSGPSHSTSIHPRE